MPITDTRIKPDTIIAEFFIQLIYKFLAFFTGDMSGTVINHLSIGCRHKIASKYPIIFCNIYLLVQPLQSVLCPYSILPDHNRAQPSSLHRCPAEEQEVPFGTILVFQSSRLNRYSVFLQLQKLFFRRTPGNGLSAAPSGTTMTYFLLKTVFSLFRFLQCGK